MAKTVYTGKVKISLIYLLALIFLLGITAQTATAFVFNGTTYNETKSPMSGVNVSIGEYTFGMFGPQLQGTYYNISDSNGNFSINVPDNVSSFYKPVIKHINSTTNTLDYIGQSLPTLPYFEVASISPIDFYLRAGGTINISAVNETGAPTTFSYMIKDTALGYPIAENFNSEVLSAEIYVPAQRNYSIMIYPNQSFPVSYDMNNLTDYTNNYANITFNTSTELRRVTGSANISDGSSNFTDFNIISYLLEPGNMVFQDHPMPYNMSAWNWPPESDVYDAVNGTYNITLPGAKMTANMLLFATAYNASTGIYYGAFRNISLNYSTDPVPDFNFTLYQLLGSSANISILNADWSSGQPTVNITTNKSSFQLRNSSGANISGFAHVEIRVNYSAYNGFTFSWMVDVSQSGNGLFTIPALSADIEKVNIFTQDSAPLKTKITASQLAIQPVGINLTSFNPGAINESEAPPVFIDMLMSTPECDVPYPQQGCSLFPNFEEKNKSDFNPFKVVLGGGKISLRMTSQSNITVHYKNVDMLASGPPDAMFDTSEDQSQSGSVLDEAWRFGSMGPEIYDEVIIGIPLDPTVNPNNVTVKLSKLYDNDWNVVWNISVNSTLEIPSDYSDFNTTWFDTGMQCSTSDMNADCYVNSTFGMVWLRIPHFSGVGPSISSNIIGNVNATLSPNSSTAGSTVNMNFTVNDTVNSTAWYNITLPSGFDASGAVVNVNINGSDNPVNWANSTSALYINVSSNDVANVTANSSTIQYINLSNITVSTSGNYLVNVTTSNGITVPLNYTVYNATGPYMASLPVEYGPLSGGYASEVSPNITLNVQVIDSGTGVNMTNVTVNASEINNTGLLTMPFVSSPSAGYYNFSVNVTVDKIVRGTYNLTVTAYDNYSISNTTNLTVVAHMYPGVNVIGYNSSKSYPAYPSNVSLLYNNSPVVIIVNTTDGYNYTNITADFSGADGNTTLEYNNSGKAIGDGNYSFTLTHTLGTIPTENVTTVWINASISTPDGPVTISRIGAFVVVSNMNPKDNASFNLDGITTDWHTIPDYSAASLTFDSYISGNRIATLRFNEAINLTDYTTAMNLRYLGQKLTMSGRSMNLTAASDALREFNKSANLTIYNLTAFTTSPAIFVDGQLIVSPGQSEGDAASNVTWDNSGKTLSFNVSHWSEYSWDGEPPSVSAYPAVYPAGQIAVKSGQSVTLNASVVDVYSGVLNVTVNVTNISSAGIINLTNMTGNWSNSTTVTISTTGSYIVNIIAYDNATNVNNTETITVLVDNAGPLVTGTSVVYQSGSSARSGDTITLNASITDTVSGVYNATVNATSIGVGTVILNNISGNWTNNSVTVDAPAGTYLLNVTAYDNLTNVNDTVQVTVSVVNYSVNLTNVSALSASAQANTNATYILNLTNTGSDDSYNLTISNPDSASVTGLNISSTYYYLASGASSIFTLNVSSSSSGTYRVNVTATSTNDSSKVSYINTTTTVEEYGSSLTAVSVLSKTATGAGTNATYTLQLTNNGTTADSYNITYTNPDSASVVGFNITNISYPLASGASKIFTLNVSNTSSGSFKVNVTATSTNDSSKVSYVNTTTVIPIVITITNPATNGSTTTNSYVNVTATLDATGMASYLNWQGVNYSMIPNTSQGPGNTFYSNITGLLSGSYTFRVYANDSSGVSNVSGTWVVTVNRTTVNSDIAAIINTSTFITNATLEIAVPSGNVTVTVPNGTNASVGGSYITSISADSLAQVNSTYVANLGTDKMVGENLSLGPEGAIFSPDIQIRINYTDAMLEAAGISASQLRVKFYNTTTNTWVEQTPYTLNETGRYIIANVSHFSTFALTGTTTGTTTTTTTTSGGNPTGNDGVTTSEPFENIEKAERRDKTLTANVPVTYSFTAPEHGVYQIDVTGEENEYDIAIRVETLKVTSKLVSTQPPGAVYKNLNVWAGTKRIKEAVIRFKVENSWLTSNNVEASKVRMVRWEDDKWVQLDTTQGTEDNSYTYYEAKTGGFSSFAIVGLKESDPATTAKPTVAVSAVPPAEGENNLEEPGEKESPGFEMVAAIMAISLIAWFHPRNRSGR